MPCMHGEYAPAILLCMPICFKEKMTEFVINVKVSLTNYVATCEIKSKLTKGFVCITHTVW